MYLKQPTLLLHSSEDWRLLKAAAVKEMREESLWKADVIYLLSYLCAILRGVYKVNGSFELPSQQKKPEASTAKPIGTLEDFFKEIDKRLSPNNL